MRGGAGYNALFGDAGNDTLDGGMGSDFLSARAGNDSIFGNAGDDTLSGGAGIDLLDGGTGSDNFIFNATPGASNIDTIQNYTVSEDTIFLDVSVFSAVGAAGTILAEGAFLNGAAATNLDHRIIFNSVTNALLYDADGSGAGTAVQFATLTGITGTITNAEFLIF